MNAGTIVHLKTKSKLFNNKKDLMLYLYENGIFSYSRINGMYKAG